MWQRGARGGGCGGGGGGFVGQWFRRGCGEPASSRRFCNIFMQSEVRRKGGKERGGKERGRKERREEREERGGKERRGGRRRWEEGRREGMREVIVTSSKLLSHKITQVWYQW